MAGSGRGLPVEVEAGVGPPQRGFRVREARVASRGLYGMPSRAATPTLSSPVGMTAASAVRSRARVPSVLRVFPVRLSWKHPIARRLAAGYIGIRRRFFERPWVIRH